jgi:hypothetical protein
MIDTWNFSFDNLIFFLTHTNFPDECGTANVLQPVNFDCITPAWEAVEDPAEKFAMIYAINCMFPPHLY